MSNILSQLSVEEFKTQRGVQSVNILERKKENGEIVQFMVDANAERNPDGTYPSALGYVSSKGINSDMRQNQIIIVRKDDGGELPVLCRKGLKVVATF